MKKITIILLCALLFVCVLTGCMTEDPSASTSTGGNSGQEQIEALRVGFARVDITPVQDVVLGYGTRVWEAERVESALTLSCIAITDRVENTLLLITADCSAMGTAVLDNICARIYDELSVPYPNVLFSSTDTQFAPSLYMNYTEQDAYIHYFVDQCLDACKLAMADRSPAELYAGTTYSDRLSFVNDTIQTDGTYLGRGYTQDWRVNLDRFITTPDNEIQLVKFARASGKDIVMMNWRAAPHSYDKNGRDDSGAISAGYVRHCTSEMEQKLDCHFAFFQGACGNVDDYSYILGAGRARSHKEQGKLLARHAIDYMPELKKVQSDIIEVKTVKYSGNIRVDSQKYIDAANLYYNTMMKGLSAAEAVAATGGVCRTHIAKIGIERRQLIYREDGGKYNLSLTAVSIGDIAFTNTPNYMFDNTGKQIKDASPFKQTFILNTVFLESAYDLPYLVSEPAYTYGCGQKDSSYFVKGTAEEIAGIYTDMLQELHQEGMPEHPVIAFDSALPNDS